jgi:hypothetical protein
MIEKEKEREMNAEPITKPKNAKPCFGNKDEFSEGKRVCIVCPTSFECEDVIFPNRKPERKPSKYGAEHNEIERKRIMEKHESPILPDLQSQRKRSISARMSKEEWERQTNYLKDFSKLLDKLTPEERAIKKRTRQYENDMWGMSYHSRSFAMKFGDKEKQLREKLRYETTGFENRYCPNCDHLWKAEEEDEHCPKCNAFFSVQTLAEAILEIMDTKAMFDSLAEQSGWNEKEWITYEEYIQG